MPPLQGKGTSSGEPGVRGESEQFNGVLGVSFAGVHAGVAGVDESGGNGVFGRGGVSGGTGNGVFGHHVGTDGSGVVGTSDLNDGVRGFSKATGHAGVAGVNDDGNGPGVLGRSRRTDGVVGESFSTAQAGAGVHAIHRGDGAAVHAEALGTGAAIAAVGGTGAQAGIFNGNVTGTRKITAFDVNISGEDCAENFESMASADIEPGTVMAIGDDARLVESDRAYDKRVAGIVSGAGDSKPGIVLGKDVSCKDRVPLALIGKGFCKVDATDASIEVGDLLTTSPTQGHAMKAEDPLKAFGAVVGKALAPLREGRGLLPILVALQ
jgi:hypothetical protein